MKGIKKFTIILISFIGINALLLGVYKLWEDYFIEKEREAYEDALDKGTNNVFYSCERYSDDTVDEKYLLFLGYKDKRKQERESFLVKKSEEIPELSDFNGKVVLYCKWLRQYSSNAEYQVYEVNAYQPDTLFMLDRIMNTAVSGVIVFSLIAIAIYSYRSIFVLWDDIKGMSRIYMAIICALSTFGFLIGLSFILIPLLL